MLVVLAATAPSALPLESDESRTYENMAPTAISPCGQGTGDEGNGCKERARGASAGKLGRTDVPRQPAAMEQPTRDVDGRHEGEDDEQTDQIGGVRALEHRAPWEGREREMAVQGASALAYNVVPKCSRRIENC